MTEEGRGEGNADDWAERYGLEAGRRGSQGGVGRTW